MSAALFEETARRINPSKQLDSAGYASVWENAVGAVLLYTGRTPELWLAAFDTAALRLGLKMINQLGVEGASSYKEGSVSVNFEDWRGELSPLLDRYRVVRAL